MELRGSFRRNFQNKGLRKSSLGSRISGKSGSRPLLKISLQMPAGELKNDQFSTDVQKMESA